MSDDVQAERIEQLIGALRDDNDALRDHASADRIDGLEFLAHEVAGNVEVMD